jgi:hypothetical protein
MVGGAVSWLASDNRFRRRSRSLGMLMSLELIVGGISQQPVVVDGQVVVRDVLNLTLAIDHDIIDGAPAARFGAELRQALETATVLTDRAADRARAG